ncbi:hypothetical protein V5799_013766 [Amblyomma americanum]|uniref:Uncharacterized protein n=1 Tax=Amblyomma americanum TaxID=6943 RepID=A0AAQ4E4Z4_AMBAM
MLRGGKSKKERKTDTAQKKQLKVAAKKTRYADILHKHLADAHNKTEAMRSEDQKHKKRCLEVSTSSLSGDDESLCSSSELRQAIASKNRWKEKALKLEAREHFLQNQITSLQRCLESKIFQYFLEWKLQDNFSNAKILITMSGELPQAAPESCEKCRRVLSSNCNRTSLNEHQCPSPSKTVRHFCSPQTFHRISRTLQMDLSTFQKASS